jgi:hypothetical protein
MILIPYDKYIRLTENTSQPPQTPKDTQALEKNTQVLENLSVGDGISQEGEGILSSLPKSVYNKGKALLKFITKHLSWNDKGEILIDDKPVTYSHIIDLVRDALIPSKTFKPIGLDEFYSKLKYIPLSLIQNPLRRQLLIDQKGSGIPPPPGIPDKKPISLSKRKHIDTGNSWAKKWRTT